MSFSNQEIELINSYGPFNHSVWEKNGFKFSNEEVLEGRANFLVYKIKELIELNYSLEQIKEMSIIDIGCYDGFILHQLSHLPFKKMIGVEPRAKNIEKGRGIRKILGIEEIVDFQCSTLEELDENIKFDIVICIGVLHHVESISNAINKLDRICQKMLVLNNLVLSSDHITDKFKVDIEMKDIIYSNESMCGLTGQKFESNYYDGSAASTSVISIPSIETMIMYLKSLGHHKFSIVASPEDFSKVLVKNIRPSKEVLLYSLKTDNNVNSNVLEVIYKYENGIMNTILEEDLVKGIYEYYVSGIKNDEIYNKHKLIFDYIEGFNNEVLTKIDDYRISEIEIIKTLRYNTRDKVTFEYAKIKVFNNLLLDSISLLEQVVQKINSDWRTCYRSFFLLSKIYSLLNDDSTSNRYYKLCKQCNPEFPLLLN